jgi:hypothetical protein
MKTFGYILITIGFLLGALTAVLDTEDVLWSSFRRAAGIGVTGIVLVRAGERRKARSKGRLASNMGAIDTSLNRIVENITKLNGQKESLHTYDVRHRIDELFIQDLARFVGARESIAHVHGLNAYAEVMSSFAAGERYLNRVWSASADGYVDEVNAYLDKAREQFTDSLEKVRGLKAERGLKV